MDAITRGLGPDSATEQEIDEAMGPIPPALQIDFRFIGTSFYEMDQYNNGSHHLTTGATIHNSNGGPGAMASELMVEIHKAVKRWEYRRNFRVGSLVTPTKGGGWKARINHIDHDRGEAALDSGATVPLKKLTVVEW